MISNPLANEGAIVQGDRYRFTILTDRMIRLEYQEDGRFTDQATQTVINRKFEVPEYRVMENEQSLEIVTKHLHVYYDKKPFSKEGLMVELKEGYGVYGSCWCFGDEIHDLMGTARTLDNVDGVVELEHGLMSRDGFTVLDDGKSALLLEDGWIEPRQDVAEDLYFFGFGHDYKGGLKEFYQLCGHTPLLPRFTLGNWWSRFYPYSEESYLTLMDQFVEKNIPLSTAVIDMDWHYTNIPRKYGSGWTGYSWNRELFPNPEGFLKNLHERGMHVTLNVHPADGVRAHEDAYLEMAKALSVDWENEDKIPFDVTSREFMKSYFTYLHHPLEEMGVDFWWIDWQQGKNSKIAGVDPLWMLNHLHFLDSARDGKMPLTFSRDAGIGSHRYPIGFSGDTVTSWESLDFQPYFTVNASNAGYTWWSHDIGGHQKGIRDDEMAVRWIQFGIFSPIMRLHSTSNEFYGKEPWNYNKVAEGVMTDFLRLRHAMIPYLYTMNYETHVNGTPLMEPMYYRNDVPEAYEVPNEYYFGSQMIVCPITKPVDKDTLLAEFDAWIPKGTYYDFFTGQLYSGDRWLKLYRSLDSIPVLIEAGGIIPLAKDYEKAHQDNPKELRVCVYTGKNGEFCMYEDDCSETMDAAKAFTSFKLKQSIVEEKLVEEETSVVAKKQEERKTRYILTMNCTGDVQNVIPKNRSYTICFMGVEQPIKMPEQAVYDKAKKELTVEVNEAGWESVEIIFETNQLKPLAPDSKKRILDILQKAQIEYDKKEQIYRMVQTEQSIPRLLGALFEQSIKPQLYGMIVECLTSDCDVPNFTDN